jgi:glycosyltransferase involved in cell wall biosynthesis
MDAEREELEAEIDALRASVARLAGDLSTQRARAQRAEARVRALERSIPAPSGAGDTAVSALGSLGHEPSRELIRAVLRPERLLRAIGWPGPEEELAQPIPVDLRGVLQRSAANSLILFSGSDAKALRRALCSIIERTAEPVAVTVVVNDSSTPIRELIRNISRVLPAIELADLRSLRPRAGAQRLDASELLPWGWPHKRDAADRMEVAYVLSGVPSAGSGGVNSVVQEARGLRRLGAGALVCVPATAMERAQRLYGNDDRCFVGYETAGRLDEAIGQSDVVVATEHTTVPLVAHLASDRPDLACAYYIQDYEPLFAELGSSRSDRALLSYGGMPAATLFAKTDFLRNLVMARHGVHVAKVQPSLDRSLFTAERLEHRRGGPTVAAMVRPRTPRRRPLASLEALSIIQRKLGEDATVMTFGCDPAELTRLDGGNWRELHHLGRLRPDEVADHMRRCDVFIDGSAYQGFGRSGLEAMACGAVPVLPSLGGVHEFALHDVNSILLDDDSPGAIAEAAVSLVQDPQRLNRLREAAVDSAAGFSIERAARSQLELFGAIRARLSREAHA